MTPAALPDGPPSRKVLSVPYCRLFRPYTFIVRTLAALHAGTDSEKRFRSLPRTAHGVFVR